MLSGNRKSRKWLVKGKRHGFFAGLEQLGGIFYGGYLYCQSSPSLTSSLSFGVHFPLWCDSNFVVIFMFGII